MHVDAPLHRERLEQAGLDGGIEHALPGAQLGSEETQVQRAVAAAVDASRLEVIPDTLIVHARASSPADEQRIWSSRCKAQTAASPVSENLAAVVRAMPTSSEALGSPVTRW